MKKTLLATLLLSSLAFTAHAAEGDVTTRPDVYYMTIDEVADSLKLLPPPPAMDSIAFLNDRAQYDKGKQLRNTPRGELAYNDAHVSGDGVPQAFSEAFGVSINEKDTPEINKLVRNFREDAGELATRGAKKHYMRIRPFAFFNEHTCRPDDEEKLSKNGSYPSMGCSVKQGLHYANWHRQRTKQMRKRPKTSPPTCVGWQLHPNGRCLKV